MAGLNSTTFDAARKIVYRQGIEKAVLEKSPFVGMMEKVQFPGKQKDLVVDVAHAGASASFTVAQAQKSSSTKYAFNMTRASLYVQGSIDGEVEESSTSEGAVASALKDLLEEKAQEFSHALSWSAWNGQGGAVGRINSSGPSTTTITLTNVSDHVNFNVGDEVQLSTTNTAASTPHSSGASATITAINRETGVLTTDSNWTSQIGSAAADDFIFKKGMVGACAAGVLAWVSPDASPGSLFGVTRTIDRNRLAGIRYPAANMDPVSAIIMARAIGRENSKDDLDVLWVGCRRYADIELSIEGKSTPVKMTGKTSGGIEIGYEGIRYGSLTIMEDPFCPNPYGLITKKKGVWKCGTTKSGLPHFQDNGSNGKLFPEPSEDANQFRMRGYFQYECHRPVSNVLLLWDEAS